MRSQSTPAEFVGLPGVGATTRANIEGEDRNTGTVVDVPRWYTWGDRKKLRFLRNLAEKYARDPHMRWFVVNEVLRPAGVQPRDYPGQAAAMLQWVQANIYYTNEPDEQIQSPWRTIKVRTGDCDDMAVLLAVFAEAIALPWKFALAGRGPGGTRIRFVEGSYMPWNVEFSHIYVMLGWPPFNPTQWASAEPTIAGVPLGFDVITNGVQEAPTGEVKLGTRRPVKAVATLPELAGYGGTIVGRRAWSGWGASTVPHCYGEEPASVEDQPPAPTALVPAEAPIFDAPSLLAKIGLTPQEVISGVVQGVIVSIALGFLSPVIAAVVGRRFKL
jgi:hypothetical protein